MPVSALALALAAAVLHASWNLLVVGAEDTAAATAVAILAGTILFAPVAVLTWHVESAAVPFILASGLLELAYIVALVGAYQRAPLSLVYPIARGTAPVLILVAGAVVLGIEPTGVEIAGVLVVCAGVMLVRGLSRDVPLTRIGWPLAVAAAIAAYTLVDRQGIRHANAVPYFELSMLIQCAYPAWIVRRRGVGALRAACTARIVLAGVAMFGAYCLVLAALRLAPPGPVAAVRESSVVIATGLAAVVLGEDVPRARLGGALLVAAGVGLLALS